MLTHFPQAVPEIPVSNVDKAAEYYVHVLGFSFDWGNDDGGIGGISQWDCRMFLTNAPFRLKRKKPSTSVDSGAGNCFMKAILRQEPPCSEGLDRTFQEMEAAAVRGAPGEG
jgi:hypothetical protein